MSIAINRRLGLRAAIMALAILLVFTFSTVRPVWAGTAGQRSTRNIILGAVALSAGIILYNNYHHKQLAHDTVVGYTRDGGVVYADGRIVYPDGTVIYTSNNGRTPCTYDGYGVPCGPAVHAYRVARYYDADDRCHHGRGHAYGLYKFDRDDEDDD